MAYKVMTAKFAGHCKACKGPVAVGDPIVWESLHKSTFHPGCKPAAPVVVPAVPGLLGQAKVKAKAGIKGYTGKPVPPSGPSYYAGQDPAPATQKGKGIHVLQNAGILPTNMGKVCTTLEAAKAAFQYMGMQGPVFCRPCPITARHGFVDSRVVTSLEGVEALWAETKAADPQGEMIVMPLVKADYNCVWRPGLLAVGPGHDGATKGENSITIFMQEGYAEAWQKLAGKAGVNATTQAPFIESVSHTGVDTVVTQIRAGVRECPTEPDWVPAPMVVGSVIVKDGKAKADPDAMLAWEHEATTLKPGYHIVYDEGGNLGDHWSVHAQLNGIAVVTTFKPHVGQEVPKMGIDLAPLEPQAIIYGFLGGLLGPSLKDGGELGRRKRTRATVAAILGTHHGLRMGGEGGAHLGASVGLFLRLAQAAVWGEARHAHNYGAGAELPSIIKGNHHLSRQQVFSAVLDEWVKGREGLRAVTRCFHQGHWGGAMGGKAWAAIGHATIALDTAMVELVKMPSRLNAKRVVAALTTAVNLAHNGVSSGCFLNKFCTIDWFDMAAGLDPRAALMAGPVWYEATLTDADQRIALLEQIEAMEPIVVGYQAPKGNVVQPKGHQGETLKVQPHYHSILSVPQPVGPAEPLPTSGKVGGFSAVEVGGTPELPGVPVKAQVNAQALNHAIDGAPVSASQLHTQIELSSGGYVSGTITVPEGLRALVGQALALAPKGKSYGGTGTSYIKLDVAPG